MAQWGRADQRFGSLRAPVPADALIAEGVCAEVIPDLAVGTPAHPPNQRHVADPLLDSRVLEDR